MANQLAPMGTMHDDRIGQTSHEESLNVLHPRVLDFMGHVVVHGPHYLEPFELRQ